MDEETILRAWDKNFIFIQRVLKSCTTKNGSIKKNERLHNSYQYCTYYKKLFSNFTQDIVRQHWKKKKIKKVMGKDEREECQRLFTLMRLAGNHEHNLKNISVGRGELLLEMRPEASFALKDYGPCPMCNSWMLRKCMSQIMRLHAQLPRQIAPLTSNSLWDNLKESYFDNIVKATLVYVEDEEDMEKRSNANIFGFDIKRNVNIEIGSSVIEKDQESKAARTRNHK